MNPFKSPGPDGLHAGFFQCMWPIVGDSICAYASNFYETGVLPEHMNETFLVLIPKVDHPETVKQLRPLSLCNVRYKIVTKAMTNRMKKILSDIIGPYQSSFVPGRHITNNIIIYQEVLHSLKKRNISKGRMVIKIELEKAYDRLSWDFIRDTLFEAGFDDLWIRNLMTCIETPKMSILWNSEKLPWFSPK